MNLFETTQAGSGDVTPAAAHCHPSAAQDSTGRGAAGMEPAKPDDSPAALRSVEIVDSRWEIARLRHYIGLLEESLDDKSRQIASLHMQLDLLAGRVA